MRASRTRMANSGRRRLLSRSRAGVADSSAAVAWSPSWIAGAPGQQELFRYRFLVAKDMCLRLPLEATTRLRAFVAQPDLGGCVHLQLDCFRPLRKVCWSGGAARMLRLPNAGGSSILSEALAFEVLARAFEASLEKTELELCYRHGSKMTDFAVAMYGTERLGVSVTRAYKWWGRRQLPAGLDAYEVRRLLKKKLAAINISSQNVVNYAFRKQLLLVWAFDQRDAMLIERTYMALPGVMRSNTVLLITRCNGVQWIW